MKRRAALFASLVVSWFLIFANASFVVAKPIGAIPLPPITATSNGNDQAVEYILSIDNETGQTLLLSDPGTSVDNPDLLVTSDPGSGDFTTLTPILPNTTTTEDLWFYYAGTYQSDGAGGGFALGPPPNNADPSTIYDYQFGLLDSATSDELYTDDISFGGGASETGQPVGGINLVYVETGSLTIAPSGVPGVPEPTEIASMAAGFAVLAGFGIGARRRRQPVAG